MKKKLEIIVSAKAIYLAQQSDPSKEKFIWSYEITITNHADVIVQLLNRYWRIIDMNGTVEEVHGVGVIGLQPLIKPGKTFTYQSYCQLPTPQGTMEGFYEMQDLEETLFQIEIPKFILSAPRAFSKAFRSKLH